MSTASVRYTNHHHVVPPKTTSPIVVAVNKAVASSSPKAISQSQSHHYHHQIKYQQQLMRHRGGGGNNGRKPKPAARNIKVTAPGNSPAKRRNGGSTKHKRVLLPPQMAAAKVKQQQQQQEQQLAVVVATTEEATVSTTAADPEAINEMMMVTDDGDWMTTTTTTAVREAELRMPDAAMSASSSSNAGNEKISMMEPMMVDTTDPMDDVASTSSQNNNNNVATVADQQQEATPAAAAAVVERRSNVELFAEWHEALALESKYQPALYLPQTTQEGEITIGARDGAAHVLRCLNMFYELPRDVLFAAINLVDRFLAKMKVRPKHLACISVGSLYVAADQLFSTKMNAEDLVQISQCRCTAGDLERMSGIIANKLGVCPNSAPVTSLTFIRLFYNLFRNAAYELGLEQFYDSSISLFELEQRLEMLQCDATCASIRASELALVLICMELDRAAKMHTGEPVSALMNYGLELQEVARISDVSFVQSHSTAVAILSRYNNQHKLPHRQRLVWKLSSRTMRVLRPQNKLKTCLPTIVEHNQALDFDSLSRLRTGSLSSEDGEDWPTSPVVPILEQM